MKRQLTLGLVLGALFVGCASDPVPPAAEVAEEHQGFDVWLDVDPAMGLPQSEVDDGLAMLQAFASPELRIHGVSVVFGNTSQPNGLEVARSLVSDWGPEGLGVFAGAVSADELGESNEAVEAMVAALEERPLTLFALGPVTNAASLVQLHPELHERIERIVMVAARRVGQRFQTGDPSNSPHRDFNFELDAPAMQVLIDSDIELVFAPWEVSSKVWIRAADLEALATTGERGAFVAEQVASWIQRWADTLGVDGFNPFDTLAIGWLTHPEQVETMDVGIWIEEAEDDVEPGATKPYLFVESADAGTDRRRAVYATTPTEDFKETLLARLGG
ncbi:MAG: nucleoside hydrolase [Acidobacteriota bacterium]